MSAPIPQPEDIGFMAKMVVAAGGLLTLFGTWFGLHKYTLGKIDKKADRDAFNALAQRVEDHTISKEVFEEHTKSDKQQLVAINSEIGIQRAHVASIFNQMRDMEKTGHERHIELLKAIHESRA